MKKTSFIFQDLIVGISICVIILGITIVILAVKGIIPHRDVIEKPIEVVILPYPGGKDVTSQERTDL